MDIKEELKKVEKEKVNEIKKNLKIQVDCGEKLNALRGSPGWKLVEDYLTKEMEAAFNILLTSKVERDIFYSQAVVVTIRKLLEKIGVSFQEATNARKTLEKYK